MNLTLRRLPASAVALILRRDDISIMHENEAPVSHRRVEAGQCSRNQN